MRVVPYKGKAPYIFISYAHKDSERVLPVVEGLMDTGYRVWFDQGIELGSEWPQYIQERLMGAELLVVFMSASAVESRNCRNEINLALKKEKELFVIYLEETELLYGMELQLSSVQSLYAERHPSIDSLLGALSTCSLLSPCFDTLKKEDKGKNPVLAKDENEEALEATIEDENETVSVLAQDEDELPLPSNELVTECVQSQEEVSLCYNRLRKGSYSVSGIASGSPSRIVIPATYKGKPVTAIEKGAFANKLELVEVILSEGIEKIGEDAFRDCYSLASIIIPNSVKMIEDSAFANCHSLVSVDLPQDLKEICSNVFSGCSSLASITIPDEVEQIEDWAFSRCSALVSITLPQNLKSLGIGAFSDCSALASITMPDSIRRIEGFTFEECTSLVSIDLPQKLESIGLCAFSGCFSLQMIVLPNKVTVLKPQAFKSCHSLKGVDFPDNGLCISDGCFEDCISLASVKIPKNVSQFGKAVFKKCTALKKIEYDGTCQDAKLLRSCFGAIRFRKDCLLLCSDGVMRI